MEYKIVASNESKDTDEALQTLEALVNQMIKEGWELQGGVSATRTPPEGRLSFYQAMTRQSR